MPAVAEPALAARAALLLGTFENAEHPQISVGEVHWHADAVRVDVALPSTGADLTILVRPNTDPSLPADYTIELRFTAAETSFQDSIEAGAPPTLRATEGAVGQLLAATVVPISAGIYLVGLPQGPDADKDAALMRNAEWFDLPIKLTGNRLAKITFEEGRVAIAAAVTSSMSSGRGRHRDVGTTICSAIAPFGASEKTKYTRRPSSSRPMPSIPAMKGKRPEEL